MDGCKRFCDGFSCVTMELLRLNFMFDVFLLNLHDIYPNFFFIVCEQAKHIVCGKHVHGMLALLLRYFGYKID